MLRFKELGELIFIVKIEAFELLVICFCHNLNKHQPYLRYNPNSFVKLQLELIVITYIP